MKTRAAIAGAGIVALAIFFWWRVGANSPTELVDSFGATPTVASESSEDPSLRGSKANAHSVESLSTTPPRSELLDPLGSLNGELLAPDGIGVEGAEIVVASVARAVDLGIREFPGIAISDLVPAIQIVRTSSNGIFTLEKLPPGEYGVLVWTPEHLPVEKILSIHSGENRVRFDLQGPGLTILGKVVDEDLKPVSGVQVVAVRAIHNRDHFDSLSDGEKLLLQAFSEVEMNEANGSFRLRGLPPGLFDIYALKEGFSQQVQYRVEAGSVDLVFAMTGSATLWGVVRDEDGNPIPSPRVASQTYFGNSDPGHSGDAFAEETGRYRLNKVKTGGVAVDLFVEADGFARAQISLSPFVSGEERHLDVVLSRATPTSGLVQDAKGIPLSGVNVFFGDVGKVAFGNLRPVNSDSEGKFTLLNTEKKKNYFVYLVKEGFVPKQCQPVLGGERQLIFTLDPYLSIQGRLHAEDEVDRFDPFTIEIFTEDEHGLRVIWKSQEFPAGAGEFHLSQISSLANGMQVWVPGYTPVQVFDLQRRVEGLQKDESLDVFLARGKRVVGRVVDKSSRRSISNAIISVLSESRSGRPTSGHLLSTQALEDGSFSIDGASVGIRIVAEGYASHIHVLSRGSDFRDVDLGEIPLSTSHRVLVRVYHGDGIPAPGMEIRARRQGLEWVSAGLTDEGGECSIEGLEPGDYEIFAWNWKSTYESGRPYAHSLWVHVEEGQDAQAVLRLGGGGTVAGKVTWSDLPDPYSPPSAAVFLLPMESLNDPDSQSRAFWASVNGAGEFWIPHVPGGRYLATLKSFYLPQRYDLSREVVVEEGTQTRLDFRALPSGLAGQILDLQTGKPVSTVRIHVLAQNRLADEPLLYSQVDGRFGVIGIAEGSYRLKASKEGFAEEEFGPFDVRSNRITEGVLLQLVPQGLLHVLASAKNGLPVVGATIKLVNGSQERLADAQGSVTFSQLKPGAYHAEIQAAGYAPKVAGPVAVEAGKQKSLYVSLRKLCPAAIRVQKSGGAPLPGETTLALIDQETGQAWPGPVVLVDGLATIPSLPEGAWKIQASGGGVQTEALVEVTPGSDNQFTLTLP